MDTLSDLGGWTRTSKSSVAYPFGNHVRGRYCLRLSLPFDHSQRCGTERGQRSVPEERKMSLPPERLGPEYGNRTRAFCLGSRRTTIIRTLEVWAGWRIPPLWRIMEVERPSLRTVVRVSGIEPLNPLLKRQLLYRLSYTRRFGRHRCDDAALEKGGVVTQNGDCGMPGGT